MPFTELEKTILMSFYALSKGSTRRYIDRENVVKKFPIRQRKAVRRYIEELVKKGYLVKHDKKKEQYRINKESKKKAAKIFMEGGVKLRL